MQFRFEKTAQLFGNRCGFWNCSKTAILGHMSGPHIENGTNHLGLPSDSAIGPSNLGPSDSQVGAIHWASPVSGRAGPDKIRPERRLLEAPMDRIRSYPLLLNSNLKACF